MGELTAGDARIADERLHAAYRKLAGTLRAVLAERLVNAPADEFEAVKIPEKEELRQRRKSDGQPQGEKRDSSSKRTPKTDKVRDAFTRLESRSLAGRRPGSGPRRRS